MKLVEKPEGYELRDRRSDRSRDAKDWKVGDALYDASKEISKLDVDAVIVLWNERLSDGKRRVHFRFAGEPGKAERLLLEGMGELMGWKP